MGVWENHCLAYPLALPDCFATHMRSTHTDTHHCTCSLHSGNLTHLPRVPPLCPPFRPPLTQHPLTPPHTHTLCVFPHTPGHGSRPPALQQAGGLSCPACDRHGQREGWAAVSAVWGCVQEHCCSTGRGWCSSGRRQQVRRAGREAGREGMGETGQGGEGCWLKHRESVVDRQHGKRDLT